MRYALLGLILVVFAALIIIASQFTRSLSQRLPNRLTPTPSVTDHVATPVTIETKVVGVYFVVLEDNGAKGPKIGCGDSLVEVKREVSDDPEVLKLAINELLSIKDSTYGEEEYYNALANSNLQIDKIEIDQQTANIYLTGSLSLGGTCDSPRVEEQLKATAQQFPSIKTANFYINNIPLSEALSQR